MYLLFLKFSKILGRYNIYTYLCVAFLSTYAAIAQLVERDLAKVEVAGSNPVCRSLFPDRYHRSSASECEHTPHYKVGIRKGNC